LPSAIRGAGHSTSNFWIFLADGSVDTVVSTFTLCTIAGIDDAVCGQFIIAYSQVLI